MSYSDKKEEDTPSPTSILAFKAAHSKRLDVTSLFTNTDQETVDILSRISAARQSCVTALDGAVASGALTAVETYLPSLFGLVDAASSLPDDVTQKRLWVSWTSSISNVYESSSFSSNQWHFEVASVLLNYAILYRQSASQTLGSLKDDTQYDAKAKEMAKALCTAAGVFEYVRDKVLPRWHNKPDAYIPEKMAETYTIMSSISIAEAQQITVKKAILQGAAPSLVAKLCMDVHNKFKYVEEMITSLGNVGSSTYVPHLKNYATTNKLMFELCYLTHSAVNAAKEAEYGVAVGYLQFALTKADPKRLPKDIGLASESLKKQFITQCEYIKKVHDKYNKMNLSISFDRVPRAEELKIPSATCIMKPVAFSPPPSVEININQREGRSNTGKVMGTVFVKETIAYCSVAYFSLEHRFRCVTSRKLFDSSRKN